ncbi:MAG: folate family ECF transporter S component, partial [Pyramidobacter porci]
MMTSGNPRSLGAGENRWLGSLREFRSIRVVAFCGVMCALAMILSAVATVNLGPYVKIGLSGIPNQVVDYLFGPAAGALFSGALEVIKFMLRPDGVYFPGFTLSAVLAGVIYGTVLYRRPLSVARVFVAHLLVKLIVN